MLRYKIQTRGLAVAKRPCDRCVGQFWPNITGWLFCGHYRSIFKHCDVIGLQKYRIRWNNAKQGLLRRSRSFKVAVIGTNRKPVCGFLLVINTNWQAISYRFEVIADYCSNFRHCFL